MNTKVYYHQTRLQDFDESVRVLLEGIDRIKAFSLTFFCEVPDSMYHDVLEKIRAIVYSSFGRELLVTLVPQIMADRDTVAVEVYEQTSPLLSFRSGQLNHVRYLLCDDGRATILLVEGIPSTDFSTGVSQQSEEIYGKLRAILSTNHFEVSDIVRQWNYVGDITGERNGRQNYQEYNNARTSFYRMASWTNGYPAATGIGAATKGIIVSCIAFRNRTDDEKCIFPVDNPLQIAAHTYSGKVLVGSEGKESCKTTPKFERAKLMKTAAGDYCFVSGTAAIRGEQSNCSLLASDQIQQTVENVRYLVSDNNLHHNGCSVGKLMLSNLRVYIKRREDYGIIRHTIEREFPGVPAIYIITEVCRKELLVEIEGICQA